MLSKNYRLRRGVVKELFKKSEERETDLFIVRKTLNKESNCRFSVLISRKFFLKAVPRNHLRRQIYEAIRLNMDLVKESHQNILLIPKKHIKDLKYQEIEKGVCEMLKSISK